MITSNGLLYIEPVESATAEPVLDGLTGIMAAALRLGESGTLLPDAVFIPGMSSRGFHFCKCGAHSSAQDYRLPGGRVTNSLAVHYLAYHRGEVPADQLDKVAALPVGPAEPTEEELQSPA